jgi:hypothetical protein
MASLLINNECFKQDKRYYNPKTFPILAPLFSFLLPAILYGINIKRTGSCRKGNIIIAVSILLEVVLFTIIVLFSDLIDKYINNLSKYFFEGINIAIGTGLYFGQKTQYDNWKVYGLNPKSIFLPIAITFLPLGVYIYLFFTNPFASNPIYEYKKNSIAYEQSINSTLVHDLCDELFNMGIFTNESSFNFFLQDSVDAYQLQIPVIKEFQNSDNIKKLLMQIEITLNDSKHFGKKVVVIQVDENFNGVKEK